MSRLKKSPVTPATPSPDSTPNERPSATPEVKSPARKKMGRPIVVTPRHRRVAQMYVHEDMSIPDALQANGFAPRRVGLKKLFKNIPALKQALEDELKEWSKTQKSALTPEDDSELVKFRLRLNTLRGEDRGTLSAKTLGSLKEVGMFDESKSGLAVHLNIANIPLEWRSRYELTEHTSPILSEDMPNGRTAIDITPKDLK